jgi:predicted secreted protein
MLTLFAIGPLIIPGSTSTQVTHPTPRISIAINTARTVVKTGSDVVVEVEMKNISQGDVPDGTAIPSLGSTGFRWDVRDSAGKQVAMTDYGIRVNHPESSSGEPHVWVGSFFSASLAPGKVISQKLALTKEYDFSKPGKYTIQASRWDGQIEVKSNTIMLTVTP